MPLIETLNLYQNFLGREILKDVNLKIEKGDVFAIIGPTGTGKTTLIRILDFLQKPSSGRILFDGVDVTPSRRLMFEARRRISYVQQKPVMFSMDVFTNVASGLKWRYENRAVIKRKVENALELVGMADFRKRDAKTLSGGETQRIAIARALVTDPELLLLDEPTANLDPVSVSKIENILENIIAQHKMTIFMATHDLIQGQRLAKKIGVIIGGKILQTGIPDDIFLSPNSTEVAEFVGVGNMLAGIVTSRDDDLVTIDVGGKPVEAISDYIAGDKVYVMVRPEDITITLSRDRSSARNAFEGQISRIVPLGSLVRIEVNCGFPLIGVLTRRSAQELNLSLNQHIIASFKATAVHIIKRLN